MEHPDKKHLGLTQADFIKLAAGVLGSYKSEKKAAASRLNGLKGGDPKKFPKKELSTGTTG